MDLEKIEDVLGEEFRIAHEEKTKESWTLEESLSKDWTDKEKLPDEDSDFDQWTVPQTLAVHNPIIEIIDAIRREYNIRSEAHAVKRGLRYGLTILSEEWEDTISQLSRNRIVAGEVSGYIPRGGMYDRFNETDILAVDWGRKVDRKSWRIIWNQKGFIKYLSEALGVDEADIVRWSMIIVGDGLGQRETIGPALQDRIQDILDEIEYRVKDIAANRRSIRRAMIADALTGRYSQDAAGLLQEKYPDVWREFRPNADRLQKQLPDSRDPSLEGTTGFLDDIK
ncbi:hypothetical protein L593_13140 [Salinarchaeum sp. Harcht-Bsk1]|uniref:hypothetical protein n=1 Tax=Salinarchaeum sp. Harcht-Bsk1 TaxID=1333523 RepID=UPI000342481F|nr:hypothetical protein [Salinarchaeum sp. Harcht-Bsk1]AGN02567.1 hypothetical protein L593_13140 [Salinarchaeum sp. Harcht-Bsk1]